MQLSTYVLLSQNSKRGTQTKSYWVGLHMLGSGGLWARNARSEADIQVIQPSSLIRQRHGNFQFHHHQVVQLWTLEGRAMLTSVVPRPSGGTQ